MKITQERVTDIIFLIIIISATVFSFSFESNSATRKIQELEETIRSLEKENLILFREVRHINSNLENCLNQL